MQKRPNYKLIKICSILNLCKYFGNYLGIKSFLFTFAIEIKDFAFIK